MSLVNVRVCPECGEEFRPEIVRCSDCGALLEDRYEGDEAPAAAPAAGFPAVDDGSELDPSSRGGFVRLFHADRAADLEPLARRLGEAGIPFRVRTVQLSFEMLIREGDAEKVRAALAEAMPAGGWASPQASPDGDPAEGACPGCGHALAAAAHECPECGLTLGAGAEGELCPDCGQARDVFGRCAACSPLGE